MQQDLRSRPSLDILRVLSVTLMVSLYLAFAWANFARWLETGQPVGLGLMVQEALIGVLYLTNRRPLATSRSVIAWLATAFGTFGMLAVRPSYDPVGGLEPLLIAMQFAGIVAAAVSVGYLGRSFGFIAANRGVKVNGAYRLVRHPIYAAYLITYLGYLLENPSLWNFAIVCLTTAFQLVRIAKEEEFLSADPAYVAYRQRVRYRLIPFIY